ncbi:serine hydrolase [Fictibacillus iocasae]|uniref:Serine hydrolase n=1 Tax=Fictibacillus iocasae TaxID=2715437 RepID=A0ABW2NSE3_9BACL
MKHVVQKLSEIDSEQVGLIVYSTEKQEYVCSLQGDLTVPLASSAKVAIGYAITLWVQEGILSWEDIVENISYNPEEDSKEIYPHFQYRTSLLLREAVEVMITCHDSMVADRVVQFCGGWDNVNKKIQSHYPTITVTNDPTDLENKGQLDQVFQIMLSIFNGHKVNPLLWTPIMNGLVRQKGDVEGIPAHHLNHMTGGLENIIVDIGMLGDLTHHPFIFTFGAKQLPSRYSSLDSDIAFHEVMKRLYMEYNDQHLIERR